MITREGLYASSDTLGAMGDAIEVFLINKGYSRQQSCSAAIILCWVSLITLVAARGIWLNTEKEHLRQFASYRS